ncbi:hypothetical protein QJS04_geneDACA005299 [Acorus gramineus]|uniref:UspA domain-containing protein n=1 Tax=Acorus gramineus TaxID=55184 RepID=A0AAV9AW43_ACOGR|nr:hypothetical protein QJS04_geneDACA005299 [Acorus gramineus]
MGRTGPVRLPGFCLNRVATRVRVRSPPAVEAKPVSAAKGPGGGEGATAVGRKVMIVVDSSPEAKCALQWALSHAVQGRDTVVLLSVIRTSSSSSSSQHGDESLREMNPRVYEVACNMKKLCHTKKPEVQVEVSMVEGKERGPMIVEEARRQGVSLLVLGQRKRSVTWRLMVAWIGGGGQATMAGAVDYCIQNSSCMALAVRKKSGRSGGYLITTKKHKDFWLLA